ncbi:MBL fold metallo-hydrolase [Paenibacillus tuaregi]|uniref:MBL fold metallo-hydrolase n=1 Tax=Paenibacillus tuaregi TaxID=1816681 RepID=UPI0008399011|nr:MBL fold metallo-hydrolase [Paenibacillus tuaregi]
MKIQLIRNATLWIEYGGLHFLVDPMFSEAGANPPVMNSPNPRNNPLVPLPLFARQLADPDAVLVTHLHPDHWDKAAEDTIMKSAPIYCQPGEEEVFRAAGFVSVQAIHTEHTHQGVKIYRTGGQHGSGEIGKMMGQVSGYVLQAEGEPVLYLAGDTIWCKEVQEALARYNPDTVVVNAGGARFLTGDPIIMDEKDVAQVCRQLPDALVIAVHMEAINHCLVTREDLRRHLAGSSLSDRVRIPADGEWTEHF